MILRWWKRRRRRRLIAQPFPVEWERILRHSVRHYARLSPDEQAKLKGDLRILVAEKNWEGCGGLTLNDEIQVTIAASASLLTLGMTGQHFGNVESILVYPDQYAAPESIVLGGGVELRVSSPRLGEAWRRGPVVLSWSDASAAARGDLVGENVVLHEFAHQLDMQSGEVNGAPLIASAASRRRWLEVMSDEFRVLRRACRHGRPTCLDCYGAKDPAEFFAVATESFFEQPSALHDSRPALYEVLADYYRQNPIEREGR